MIPRLLVLLATLLTASSAWALTLPDHPDGRVSDYAGALSPSARANLEQQIAQATAGRSLQVAVAIFPSLDGGSIEDTSIRLAEKWKIGGRSSDDGVLITLFVADRKMRIEVGYGLEAVLPDVAAKRIVADVMAPRLRAGDMEGGLRDGVAAVLQAAGAGDGKTATTAPTLAQPTPRIHVPGWLVLAVIGVVVLFVIAAARSGRKGGGYSGGSSGWAQQAGTSLLWNILWSVLFSGGRGGRGGGSWGGGGGGGGGFSGGGGSFGGGGASGSW